MSEPVSPESVKPKPALTTWIMLAVLAWGTLLALGSYLFGGNHPEWRAVIVFGVTCGFLGLWLAALALRGRRSNS